MTAPANWQLGSPNQHQYAMALVGSAGFDTLLDAASDILDRDPDVLIEQPPSVEDATKVISRLKELAPERPASASNGDAPARKPPRFLTARQLRRVALGQQRTPPELDADAVWVVEHLRRSLKVEAMYVSPAQVPLNGNEPITIEQLLTLFDGWDGLAKAFDVSVPTAKAWGAFLPGKYAWQAEILTGGKVRAPRA